MKTYEQLTEEEQRYIYNKAFTFKHDHADHVAVLISDAKVAVAPSGYDRRHPELWKGIHWKWFEER